VAREYLLNQIQDLEAVLAAQVAGMVAQEL